MRLFSLSFLVAVICCLNASAQSTVSEGTLKKPKTAAEKKLEREIVKAEQSLGKAIGRRDLIALSKLLTDYYADAFEGSDRAANKKTTLARCKDGSLHFYRVDVERTITASADIVTVEGIAVSEHKETKDEKDRTVHVKRLWTKKGSRWQLVGQTVGLSD